MRRAAIVGLIIAACEAAEAAPDRALLEPAFEPPAIDASPTAVAAPASCWPVPQPFALSDRAIARLPVSTRAYGRRTAAEVLIEVRAIPDRPDTAEVVIDGHTIADMRDPASYRLLMRWVRSTYAADDGSWDPRERGYAIAAEAGVDAAVVAEVIMLATGSSLGGPVDVVLRHPGTSATTTIPVALGETGVTLEHGPWGAWARAIDAADPSTTVALELPEIASETWKAYDELPETTVDVQIDTDVRDRSVAPLRYRRAIERCAFLVAVGEPDLRGTWLVRAARAGRGRPTEVTVTPADATPRMTRCLTTIVPEWTMRLERAPLVFSITAMARP